MRFFCALISLSLTCICALPAHADKKTSNKSEFIVFDATKYDNKPDMNQYGIRTIPVLYHNSFFDKGANDEKLPKDERIIALAKQYSESEFIVLDIEHWKTQNYRFRPWIPANNIKKYLHVYKLFKAHAKKAKIGYFAKVPISNYKLSLAKPKTDLHTYWVFENQKMLAIANVVDIAFPSVYTYEKDWCKWEASFLSKVTELRKIFMGKFYVFLWPQYHERPTEKGIRLKLIPGDFWRFQLETVRKLADGVVIWGGWNFDHWGKLPWKDDVEWWKATKEFMQSDHASTYNKSCKQEAIVEVPPSLE